MTVKIKTMLYTFSDYRLHQEFPTLANLLWTFYVQEDIVPNTESRFKGSASLKTLNQFKGI